MVGRPLTSRSAESRAVTVSWNCDPTLTSALSGCTRTEETAPKTVVPVLNATDTLAASVSVAFSTGTTVLGAVSSVRVHPDSADVSVGSQFQLTVTARDSADREVSGRPTIWSTCVPTVISVSAAGLVTALAHGDRCRIPHRGGRPGRF